MQTPGEETKKRGPDSTQNIIHPHKKQKAMALANPPPPENTKNQTQGEVDVLKVQKKAMHTRIQELQLEKENLNQKIKRLEHKQSHYDDNIAAISFAWNHLNENLQNILSRVEKSTTVFPVKDGKIHASKLIQLLLQSKDTPDDPLTISERLKKRSEETQSILVRVLEVFEKERARTDEFCSTLHQTTAEPKFKALLEENERLRSDNQSLKSSLDESHFRNQKMSKTIDELKTMMTEWNEKKKEMEEEMLDLKEKCEGANRKLFRQEQNFQEQIEELKKKMETMQELPTAPSDSPNELSKPTTPPPSSSSFSDGKQSDAVKALQSELAELSVVANSRLESLQKYQEERVILLDEIQKLRNKPHQEFTNEMAMKSEAFQILQAQQFHLAAEFENLKSLNDKLSREANEVFAIWQTEKEKIMIAESQRREILEGDIKKLQGDVMQLRAERDSLNHTLDMKNASSPGAHLHEARSRLESELRVVKEQLTQIRKDYARLKTAYEENMKRNPEKESLQDTLIQKNYEIKDLQSKVEECNKQIKLLKEGKYDKFINPELQKRLEDEISSLRKENSIKLAKSDRLIEELRSSLEVQKQNAERLKAEIDAMETGFAEMEEQNRRLTDQLAEKEASLAKVIAEQIKATHLHNSLKEERNALIDKLSKSDERYNIQSDLLKKVELKAKQQAEEIKKGAEQYRALHSTIEGLKRLIRDMTYATNDSKGQLDRMDLELKDAKLKGDAKTIQLEKEVNKNERLEEEIRALKRKVEQFQSSGSDSLMIEENKILKGKLKCSVCNEHEKDVVITRCFHCFCRRCIQKNLEVRSRKCPACQEKFGENDVHTIYLS